MSRGKKEQYKTYKPRLLLRQVERDYYLRVNTEFHMKAILVPFVNMLIKRCCLLILSIVTSWFLILV